MKKKGEVKGTNQQLAMEQSTTARQISKSRKRGWITNNDGVRIQYTAPTPVFK